VAKGSIEPDVGRRIIWGIFLVGLCVFLSLSLLSYDWRDISALKAPPTAPPANLFGPVGAWLSFVLLMSLGVAAFLAPMLVLLAGAILIFNRQSRIWPRILWCLALLLALVSMAQLDGGTWGDICYKLNIMPDAGGKLGRLFMKDMLVAWLSPVGAGVLVWILFFVSLVMTIERRNITRGYHAAASACGTLAGKFTATVASRQDDRQRIEREERKLDKRRRQLERIVQEKAPAAHGAESQVEEVPEPDPEADAPVVEQLPKRERRRLARKQTSPEPDQKEEPVNVNTEPQLPPGGRHYVLPPTDMLHASASETRGGAKADTATTSRVLIETLAEFGIEGEIVNVETGPVVTCYELLPAPGVRVERISGLANNLALSLKANSVRVQAPIPGKGVVGIEVPNSVSQLVPIRAVIDGDAWEPGRIQLPIVLGKDVSGNDIVADLADMPHLLIAGATGSGKTVCMNSILAALLMSRTPDQLRLVLVDPKIVEFSAFNRLPHLVVPVITDPKKVALGLRWAINEMEQRYKLFARAGVRNITSYNSREIAKQEEMFGEPTGEAAQTSGPPDRVPYIVIVIDELADLMLADQADIENSVARLAQLSRAVGIHMIIATQRPSVNVITGTIKANFPARIGFQVAQRVDSRTILDTIGAEKLLGRGDMLYLAPGSSKLIRAQGVMTSDKEIRSITDFWREQGEPQYELVIKERLDKAESGASDVSTSGGGDDADSELLEKSIEIIRETRRASTSSLQRRLRIGYTRAARIIDILEERGILGPPRGSEPREILIDLDVDMQDSASEEEIQREQDEELEKV
jgi:S-DNA-T family DNA segregation ATPase FtsK/SpoIIIE